MKKLILAVMAAFLFGLSAFAQPLLVQDKDYEKFTKISVEDYFVLRFIKADRYSVTLKADERIAAHVQAYVKNGTLYLDLDEKSFSSELKKALRQATIDNKIVPEGKRITQIRLRIHIYV